MIPYYYEIIKKSQEEIQDILEEAGYNVTKTGTTSSISKTIITNKKDISDEELKEIKDKLKRVDFRAPAPTIKNIK